MKLSDIKGERSLDIMADAMELAELLSKDGRFKAFVDELKDSREDADRMWVVFCKHFPALIRDGEYKSRIVSIFAAASGVSPEEYAKDGPLLQDLFELLTSDAESLGFLAGSVAKTA